jgi:hypothetical protein
MSILDEIKKILPEALMIFGGMLFMCHDMKSLLGIICVVLGIYLNRDSKLPF